MFKKWIALILNFNPICVVTERRISTALLISPVMTPVSVPWRHQRHLYGFMGLS